MHVLEETSAEPSLQARQLQLKRARLADDLSDKISHQPAELIHNNILPVPPSLEQAILETEIPKAALDNWSCDEDSGYSLSPEQPVNQESSLILLPQASPPPCTQVTLPSQTTQISGSSPLLKLADQLVTPSTQSTCVTSQKKSQLKPNADYSAQKQKKVKDDKPKIKKLKYHQYVPPDQRGDKEPSICLDSPYAKIVQQQQLVLQLQIINQQQQQNYHAILPATLKPQMDQQSSSSTPPVSTPSTVLSNQGCHKNLSSASTAWTKPATLPPNLDEMKVAELKSELKLRSLPVSGTKIDLIERLRTYQGLNEGSSTTSFLTAGGTTGLTTGEEGKSSKTAAAATINNNTSQHHTSLSASFSSTSVTLAPSHCSPGCMSPEDTGFNCDQQQERMSSPHTQLSLQACSAAPLPNIKEEQMCSTSAPCQFTSKPACLQKHRPVSLTGPSTTASAPVVTMDKDKMLREKDKQIEELTRMLRQIQRVVEALRMQLECGKRGGHVPETHVLVRVKQEPPDKPSVPLSFHNPPLIPAPAPFRREMDVTKVSVKQETIEAEEFVSETTVQIPDAYRLPKPSTQTPEAREQIKLQMKPEQTSTLRKQHLHLQQTTPKLAHHQAIEKHLLQRRHNSQSPQQTPQRLESEPKLSHQQKTKSHKPKLKQQKQLLRQHPQEMQLKQQTSLKQQKLCMQPQKSEQLQRTQVQTKMLLKQQQEQQQVPQVNINQVTGWLELNLLKRDLTPTLVSDGNSNSSLITLTNYITGNQRSDAPGSKAANHIPQVKNGGPQVSVEQPEQEVVPHPSTLESFLKDQETSLSGRNTLSPSSQNIVCPCRDDLLSPLSSASIKLSAPSPDKKDREHEDDFIDSTLQRGESLSAFKPSSTRPLDELNPNPSSSPCLNIPQFPLSEPQTLLVPTEEEQHLSNAGSGCLEDFLESTMGKPLLGVEPGGPLTLIDDLHSEMLCTPSILDPPPSPMDTLDIAAERERGADSMDWLDFDVGGKKEEEAMTLDPLGPQTPPSVFSTDFLDSCDLQIHWDSCL
ncbi:myocardin-related transcription factor A-like isoform X2 [Cheilinus undulatus]|nr:myocardin-related transcription factor A-like isoform X2 [Cheilinus undulatus]